MHADGAYSGRTVLQANATGSPELTKTRNIGGLGFRGLGSRVSYNLGVPIIRNYDIIVGSILGSPYFGTTIWGF